MGLVLGWRGKVPALGALPGPGVVSEAAADGTVRENLASSGKGNVTREH